MKGILEERIHNATLTKTEQKIADYFLSNRELVGQLPTSELAKNIGVSEASIIRFSRSIGYKGFSDMKNDIYCDLVERAIHGPNQSSLVDRFNRSIGGNSSCDIAEQFMCIMQRNIMQTFRQNTQEQYEIFADLIANTWGTRYIVGFQGCTGAAVQFARLLQFLYNNVAEITSAESDSVARMQNIGPDDLVMMLAFSRFYKIDMDVVKTAKDRRAKICIITNSWLAPMLPYANASLVVETDHIGFSNSTVALTMVMEYILTLLTSRDPEQTQTRLKERDACVENYLL